MMTAGTTATGYSHTQTAPLCLLLYGPALVCFVSVWLAPNPPAVYITGGTGALLVLLAAAFHHLTVEDQDDVLAIRFGPVPLFRRTVRYVDIASVEVGRTSLLDGWGIHWSMRGGWVWNLWGFDCVVVHFHGGGKLRIGTDDADNLAAFLRRKVHQTGTAVRH